MAKSQIKSGAVFSYLSIFTNIIVGLLIAPVMLKFLGDTECSLYNLIGALVGYISVLDFGISNAIIRYVAKYRLENKEQEQRRFLGMAFLLYTLAAKSNLPKIDYFGYGWKEEHNINMLVLDMGCLEEFGGGEYYYKNNKMDFSKERVATEFRKNKIGFIVQYFGLIDDKNVYQNVALPLKYQKRKKSEIRKKVTETLRYFEIESKIKAYPNQLSGGQKQRVAIARAVVKESEIILADEPTGALDEENGRNVMKVLKELNESGKTVIIVTHDNKIAGQCNRIIEIRDGEIVDENKKTT